jgi:AraC-like DNA-binding protein
MIASQTVRSGRGPRWVRQLRAAKVHAFLAEADRAGIDMERPLRAQGLSRSLFTDPKRWVAREDVSAAFEALAQAVPADFAVRMGGRWTFQEFGLVGYGLLSCRTYGEFADRWLDHIEFIGLPLSFRAVVRADGWSLEMRPRIPLSPAALRMCVEEACASVFPLHREICGVAKSGACIELTDHDAQRGEIAATLIGTTVRQGMPVNRLIQRTADRGLTIKMAEDVLRVFVGRHCGAILPELAGRNDLLGQVRERLLLSCGRPAELGEAAAWLELSKRTLNRRLAQAGWTYAGLVERYRQDYALALLRSRELCTKEISFMLDFENASSFRRAFRRWTGEAVGAWALGQLGQRPKRR